MLLKEHPDLKTAAAGLEVGQEVTLSNWPFSKQEIAATLNAALWPLAFKAEGESFATVVVTRIA